MIEEKYRTYELCQFDYSEIWEKSFDKNYTDKPLRNDEVIKLLNEQDNRIKELEKEKQDLKDKAKIILDYYSRRYVNAIFNDRKHSKQFKSDLWSVKEVLYVLDLHDGDIDG